MTPDSPGDQRPHTFTVPTSIDTVSLYGPGDEYLRIVEDAFDAAVHARGNQLTVTGAPAEVALVERLLDELVAIVRTGQGLTAETVERSIGMLRTETQERPAEVLSLNILSNRGRTIRPKTLNQKKYVESIDKHTITFGVGPAGTGKTFLAAAWGASLLRRGEVDRLVITRPAVEAGERLGFLPGDLNEKVDPYLAPIWEALNDILGPDDVRRRRDRGEIEAAPIAFMRGRTLSHAFIIADEAQNLTRLQMKMVLTRLGEGARMVVTGDPSQVDLLNARDSGLAHALTLLRDVKGVGIMTFEARDVVRHALVERIVRAYDSDAAQARGGVQP